MVCGPLILFICIGAALGIGIRPSDKKAIESGETAIDTSIVGEFEIDLVGLEIKNDTASDVMTPSRIKRGAQGNRRRKNQAKAKKGKKQRKAKTNSPMRFTVDLNLALQQQYTVACNETFVLPKVFPTTYNIWRMEKARAAPNKMLSFNEARGEVTIDKSGVYTIYAQVLFQTTAPGSGLAVQMSRKDTTTDLTRCVGVGSRNPTSARKARSLTTALSSDCEELVIMPCSTLTVAILRRGDVISVKGLFPSSYLTIAAEATHWEIVKIG